MVGVALRDAAARGPEFNGRPFFRVFIGLFNELAASPGAQETAELPYLVGYRLETLDRLQALCDREHVTCADADDTQALV